MSQSIAADLTIAVLLPDLLGTYSDAGNAVVLAERARRRGISTEVLTVTIADAPPHSADIYVVGGGEDAAQPAAARWLLRHRMRDELAERHVVLAVCAGFQLLGTTITDRDGRYSTASAHSTWPPHPVFDGPSARSSPRPSTPLSDS
jgi:hypothetical protein